MKIRLVVLMLMFSTIAMTADSQLIRLVDPADPLLITNAAMQYEDDVRPVVIVELENQTDLPIATDAVWLSSARFYTKAEAEARNRQVWDCGKIGTPDAPKKTTIHPHSRVVVRMSVESNCVANREHEHYWIEVTRLGNFANPSWKREPSEFSRLLIAAQPHP